jgi:hypothetical protein
MREERDRGHEAFPRRSHHPTPVERPVGWWGGHRWSAGATEGRGFSLPPFRSTRLFGDAPLAPIAGDRPKEAWLLGGPFFVGAGGGFRFAFSPRIAFTGVTRVALGIGNSGVIASIVPEVALQCGF